MFSRILRFALVATLPLGGCTFSRAVVNPEVRDIDTSWIVPGKTTRRDIVARIGFPPHVRELGGVKPNSFRWTTYDLSTRTLAAGYIVTPTFEKGHERFAHDILVCFDERGVVTLLSRTAVVDGRLRVVDWKELK